VPPPVPRSGEPEDLITAVRATVPANAISSLFELVVTAESGRPLGSRDFRLCNCCGREEYDQEQRQLAMREDMWHGEDIFFLATTLHIMVTERVRELLQKLGATNVQLTSLTAAT
jgi:hypothetical protein